jgi:hypothetical protein
MGQVRAHPRLAFTRCAIQRPRCALPSDFSSLFQFTNIVKVHYNQAIEGSKSVLQAAARTYKKPKKNESAAKDEDARERERERALWAWKGYLEPEGSRFGKGVVDYSPAWFMQAQTVSCFLLP